MNMKIQSGVQKKQNKCMNFFKGIAILLVVVLHCEFPTYLGSFINMIARIGVPFFFMVSGYFLYSENTEEIKKKISPKIAHIFRLCVVYVVLNVLYIVVTNLAFNKDYLFKELAKVFSLNNLLDLIIFNRTILGMGGVVSFCLVILLYFNKVFYRL